MKILGLVGATCLVGQTFLDIIAMSENFFFDEIKLYASKSSVGKVLSVGKKKCPIEEITLSSLLQCHAVVFACESSIAREYIPKLAEKGIFCVDKSSAFRDHPTAPLMVPEINASLFHEPSFQTFPVVASPNCCAIPLSMVLKALDQAFGVTRAVVSTYQSVSGAGKAAVDVLTEETKNFFQVQDIRCEKSTVFPKSIAFNVMPFVSSILENGHSEEEEKIVLETKKILQKKDLLLSVTSVRVPTFVSHAQALSVELDKYFDMEEVLLVLSKFPGLKVVDEKEKTKPMEDEDNPIENFVTPREAHGQDEVFISRIRKCEVFKNGLSLWVVCDNLRKGAALNAWQILQSYYLAL